MKVSPSRTRKRKMTKSLESLVNGEDNNLSWHSNQTAAYCALPDNLPLLENYFSSSISSSFLNIYFYVELF